MNSVTISPKYQIVIPLAIRQQMGLRPGEKLQIVGLENRIELVPIRPMREMRGFLKGHDSSFLRDEEDRI